MNVTVAGSTGLATQYRGARPVVDSVEGLHIYVGKSSVVKAYYNKGEWKSFTTIDEPSDDIDWKSIAEEVSEELRQVSTRADALAARIADVGRGS